MSPKCRRCRTRDGRTSSLLRRAPEGRARAPEGSRKRKTGGEIRSAKDAIVGAAGREEKRRIRAPNRKSERRRRRRGMMRGKRSVKDAIIHVLSLQYRFLVAVVNQHLFGRLHSLGMVMVECTHLVIHMFAVTHSYASVCSDSFICVTRLIHMCDMTRSYV